MGAAVGAAIGSVFSRNAASTGGAIGAMVGMTVADTRDSASSYLEEAREVEFGTLSSDGDGDSPQN
ncbi:17 kDa surface antigen [Natronorubrum tibetense GA33]|uniref:17 kDa surface antigen n=2 Tax=Natronorubrum tibetense TaxID=63128 RepID=L9VNI4_9EURY|nr:17 kDa surface antigen [Natronorubrum tibetense GA33]